MKNSGTIALLALAGAAFIPSAAAQTALNYQLGDLFLGFRTTGASTPASSSYVINIGQASQFLDNTNTFTLSLGNIGADLSAVFGANWFNRSDLFWGVSGTVGRFNTALAPDPAKTYYASIPELTAGTYTDNPWDRLASSPANGVAGKMEGLGGAYASTVGIPNLSTANSPVGYIQANNASNSYASYMPGGTTANSGPAPGTSFAAFNPTIEGSFAGGSAATALDLIRLTPGSGDGDIRGRFTITNGAAVSYTGAVPEPTSFGLLAFGAASLLMRRRRPATA